MPFDCSHRIVNPAIDLFAGVSEGFNDIYFLVHDRLPAQRILQHKKYCLTR